MILASANFTAVLRGASRIAKSNLRYYGSITKINTKILRNFALAKDPNALKVELLRVVKEAAGTTDSQNFPKIIAQICVGKWNVELDLAFEILGCLEDVKPKSMMLGLYELVDECVEHGHIDEAMRAYSLLLDMKEKLDICGKQRLLNVLAYECRIKDIMQILTDHSVTDGDLVTVAEPLIMSGNMKLFTKVFGEYLLEKSVASPVQCSERVARVLRSVIYARMRRYIQLGDLSSEEKIAIKETMRHLKYYHSLLDPADVMESPSFFQTCQLYETEKDRMKISEMAAYDVELSIEEHRALNRLPRFETTNFPYIVEGDDGEHMEMRENTKIRDLSSELKKQDPSRVLLYRNFIFPAAYELEMKLLKEKNMEKFMEKICIHDSSVYSLIGALQDDMIDIGDSDSDSEEGYDSMDTNYDSDEYDEFEDDSDSDSDSEDNELVSLIAEYTKMEEESFTRLNRTVRTLVPPSFKLNDITESLDRRKPSITLEFAESIFDYGPEPTAWPRPFMPGGFILHKNEKKNGNDPLLKN